MRPIHQRTCVGDPLGPRLGHQKADTPRRHFFFQFLSFVAPNYVCFNADEWLTISLSLLVIVHRIHGDFGFDDRDLEIHGWDRRSPQITGKEQRGKKRHPGREAYVA